MHTYISNEIVASSRSWEVYLSYYVNVGIQAIDKNEHNPIFYWMWEDGDLSRGGLGDSVLFCVGKGYGGFYLVRMGGGTIVLSSKYQFDELDKELFLNLFNI